MGRSHQGERRHGGLIFIATAIHKGRRLAALCWCARRAPSTEPALIGVTASRVAFI